MTEGKSKIGVVGGVIAQRNRSRKNPTAPRLHFLYLNYCLSAQCTIPTSNLSHETCRIMFIKVTAKSKFLRARPKLTQLVKILFIVFHLAHVIFTGQISHLSPIYTAEKFWHGSDEKSTRTKKIGSARIDFVL